jgi:predicted MPP superfamily phosphohydrolase
VAQHLLMPTDWPAALVDALGQGRRLDVLREDVRSARPLGGASALRIAFAADLHAGPTTHDGQIDRAFAALHASGADLVLLGGDFVGHRPRDVRRLARHMRKLHAPLGVFAVLGNHDNNTDPALVSEVLAENGVQLLLNRAVTLPAPFGRTRLIGLDDHTSGAPDVSRIPPDDTLTTILLVHQPSGLLDAGAHRIDLALAGHTHGGQLVLPSGYAPITPAGPYSRRYLAGRFALDGGGTLLVTRGVGTSTVPVRWNAPADLRLVTLHAASDSVSS